MTVWEEIRNAFLTASHEWMTGGDIARVVRAVNPARSEATVRASVAFYCINDRSKNSSAGHVYLSNPLLMTNDPGARGKRYRLLTKHERTAFLASPRADLETLSLTELLSWLHSRDRRVLGSPGSSPRPTTPTSGTEAPQAAAAGHVSAPRDDGPARRAAALISQDFLEGKLDLRSRPNHPSPGWEAMPEYKASQRWLTAGASPADVRGLLTLVSAMDRARNADQLWENAAALFAEEPWACRPATELSRPVHDLKDVLSKYGVSQCHLADSGAWRLILESLADSDAPGAVHRAIYDGIGDARELLSAARSTRASGQPWFPFLGGPKVSVMWVRMLSWPGRARISGLELLPVAVDVQVRRVTEMLGITETRGVPLEAARSLIAHAWQDAASEARGPEPLSATAAALDPALWFFGKWGCSFCERAQRKLAIGSVCEFCAFTSPGHDRVVDCVAWGGAESAS